MRTFGEFGARLRGLRTDLPLRIRSISLRVPNPFPDRVGQDRVAEGAASHPTADGASFSGRLERHRGRLAGILLALTGGVAARSLLFELEPYGPAVLGGAVALFCAVAGVACYLPARRAARLDPRTALREE